MGVREEGRERRTCNELPPLCSVPLPAPHRPHLYYNATCKHNTLNTFGDLQYKKGSEYRNRLTLIVRCITR